MLTHATLVQLDKSLRDKHVLSVYVNGEITDAGARSQWKLELRNALDQAEASMRESTHTEREAFRTAREAIMADVESFTPGDASPGWIGFATADGIERAQSVPVPVPTVVTWSRGADLGPAIRVLKEGRPVLVVVADNTQVRIHRYAGRAIHLAESLERVARVDEPSHTSKPSKFGYSSGIRGQTGADAAQRELRQATENMLSNAASRISELAGDDAWILVGGIQVVAASLLGRLSNAARGRAEQVAMDVNATEPELAAMARDTASRIRAAHDAGTLEQVIAESATGGAGVTGPERTDRALTNAQVRELYLTSGYLAAHRDEAARVIQRAFDEGATVEHVSGPAAEKLDAAGGIAARLRYAESKLTGSSVRG
jgi:hypothetical protein